MYVEGSLRTRKYTDKDDVEKYATDIRADEMKMLGSRQGMGGGAAAMDDDGGYGAPAPRQQQQYSAPVQQPRQAPAQRPAPNFSDMDDDIPF